METVFTLNQKGRDKFREALAECLKAQLDPEQYADAVASEVFAEVRDGEPEASFEVRAWDNIHGTPWTITVAGHVFFDAEPVC